MDNDPIDLRARERRDRDLDTQKRIARLQQVDDMRWLLKTEQGRRFVWRLLEKAGIYRSTYSQDASHAAFLEGVRSVGLMVIADVFEADPDAYAMMLREQPK